MRFVVFFMLLWQGCRRDGRWDGPHFVCIMLTWCIKIPVVCVNVVVYEFSELCNIHSRDCRAILVYSKEMKIILKKVGVWEAASAGGNHCNGSYM